MVLFYYSTKMISELKNFRQTVVVFTIGFIILRKVVVLHSIAILSTVFRLVYRLWTRRFWWEDAWAALAMISDGRIFRSYAILFITPTSHSSCLPGMYLDRYLDKW